MSSCKKKILALDGLLTLILIAFDQFTKQLAVTHLKGKEVIATDLRAGAAMMVAGMLASGTTTITNIEHILRGYENIVDKLSNVGADIKLIDE